MNNWIGRHPESFYSKNLVYSDLIILLVIGRHCVDCIGCVCAVLGHMFDEQFLAVGAVIAVFAVEHLGLSVAEEMWLEVAWLRECVTTDDTLEWLLLSVSAHVVHQRTAHCEPLRTQSARVRLVAWVLTHVNTQITLLWTPKPNRTIYLKNFKAVHTIVTK